MGKTENLPFYVLALFCEFFCRNKEKECILLPANSIFIANYELLSTA